MITGMIKVVLCALFAFAFAQLWVAALLWGARLDSTALNVSIFLAPIAFCGWRAGSHLLRGRS